MGKGVGGMRRDRLKWDKPDGWNGTGHERRRVWIKVQKSREGKGIPQREKSIIIIRSFDNSGISKRARRSMQRMRDYGRNTVRECTVLPL